MAAAEAAEPKTYRALSAVYVDERYIVEGETFTTAKPKGEQWEEIVTDAPARGGRRAASAADD